MHNEQKGFISLIVMLIVVFVILGYLGFDIRQVFSSPAVKANLQYFWSLVVGLWNNVLVGPVTFLWHAFLAFIAKLQASVSSPAA